MVAVWVMVPTTGVQLISETRSWITKIKQVLLLKNIIRILVPSGALLGQWEHF